MRYVTSVLTNGEAFKWRDWHKMSSEDFAHYQTLLKQPLSCCAALLRHLFFFQSVTFHRWETSVLCSRGFRFGCVQSNLITSQFWMLLLPFVQKWDSYSRLNKMKNWKIGFWEETSILIPLSLRFQSFAACSLLQYISSGPSIHRPMPRLSH